MRSDWLGRYITRAGFEMAVNASFRAQLSEEIRTRVRDLQAQHDCSACQRRPCAACPLYVVLLVQELFQELHATPQGPPPARHARAPVACLSKRLAAPSNHRTAQARG